MIKHPDSSQIEETAQTTCAQTKTLRTIAPEQLRRSLCDHRNSLRETRRALLTEAHKLEREIAAIDAMLADLITG